MIKWFSLLAVCFFSGCLVRTYTVQKPRVDLDIQGNQGYIFGKPEQVQRKESRLTDKRTISVVEIELGSHTPKEYEKKETTTNISPRTPISYVEEVPGQEKVVSEQYQYYTIQKNDTLQKISQKFYKTTRKWKLLYEINKDVLKNPDKIYPGTKIKIPNE
ncbi:MAG: LysM peptidoglycan-binding domain-containing protein [Candidatus Omnitrophica bacterium]|nr:LysM peptidoglycan-binding domain-containing protein [Candidatus Omnitrophota bacterium]